MPEEISSGTVVRYCKPMTLDNNKPKPSCFQLREDEPYLSVYLLDYFGKLLEKENVVAVKQFMESRPKPFGLKPTAIFATLHIEESKQFMFEQEELGQEISRIISYQQRTLPHCGIFHYFQKGDDLLIAKLLSRCVKTCYLIKQL